MRRGQVAGHDQFGAGGEGGQELERSVETWVTSGAIAQRLLDLLAIARLTRVLGMEDYAELAAVLCRDVGGKQLAPEELGSVE